LIIIDISDPAKAHIVGRCPVVGYPVEMYVVDFLAIVTVRSDYNFWSRYWGMGDSASGTGTIGTMIYIINARDPANPVILKIVELEGFASESRRVGHVIYETTNTYSWYSGGAMLEKVAGSESEPQEYTTVSSIDLSSPKTLGLKDRVKFSGSSNQVYASPTAFYIAQSLYLEAPWYSIFYGDSGDSGTYYTKVTFLDIRDPNGDIVVRDHFSAPGNVYDKYQMDEYNHMFRMVSHHWTDNGEQSWLYIYNVSDPRDIKTLGKLLIDDAGSLTSTRFAGDRAYLIHIPHAIDPLDVVDLSDPKNPRMCDKLEMPGWVTHMDVYGNYIIALGMDNSDNQWNVAVSLFNVKDPDNAVLLERVRLGGTYSYSTANWEPKALTTDMTHHIVIVPFESWNDASWNTTAGFQIVSFDLEKGDLELRGEVRGAYSIERTRVVGDYILTDSYKDVQVVDIKDLAKPVVKKIVDICVNVIDVVPMGGYYLQLVQDWAFGGLALRSVTGMDDVTAVGSANLNASWGHLYLMPSGVVLATDLRDGNNQTGTLFTVKVATDGKVTVERITGLPTGTPFLGYGYPYGEYAMKCLPNYYYYSPYDDQRMGMVGNAFVFVRPSQTGYVEYAYDDSTGRYSPVPMVPGTTEMYIFDLSNLINVPAPVKMSLSTYQFIGMQSWKNMIYIQHQYTGFTVINYVGDSEYANIKWNYRNYAVAIDIKDPSHPLEVAEYNIPGRLVSVGDGVLYTIKTTNGDTGQYDVLTVLKVGDGMATVLSSMDLKTQWADVVVSNGMAYVMSTVYPQYEMDGGSTQDTTKSYLKVIDLSDPANPKLVASFEFDGILSVVTAQTGHVVLYDSTRGIMMVYAAGPDQGLTFNAMVNIQGYPEKVRIVESTLFVPEGYYGVVGTII
jgi:hypothetical protein